MVVVVVCVCVCVGGGGGGGLVGVPLEKVWFSSHLVWDRV